MLGYFWHTGQYNRIFPLQCSKVDPINQAAAAESIVNLGCAIRSNNHYRRFLGLNRTNFWNGYLEVRKELQQKSLKFLVAAIQLINKQDRSLFIRRINSLQERALYQEIRAKNLLEFLLPANASHFHQTNVQHLARIVPLIDRGAHIDPFVALQTNQLGIKNSG